MSPLGSRVIVGAAAAVAAIVSLGYWRSTLDAAEARRVAAAVEARIAANVAKRAAACSDGRAALLDEYNALRQKGHHFPAARRLDECAKLLEDGELRQKILAAEAAALVAQVTNPSADLQRRLDALESLSKRHPEEHKIVARLQAPLQAQAARLAAQAEAKERAAKRKQGVRLGMTEDDVVASSWGRPRKINRTVNAYGVREQWVYDGGYLYFENGVLVSYQN